MIFKPKPDNVSQEDYDKLCKKDYDSWLAIQARAEKFDVVSELKGNDFAWERVYGITPFSNVKFESKPTGRLLGE
jgi:hypothetical protein